LVVLHFTLLVLFDNIRYETLNFEWVFIVFMTKTAKKRREKEVPKNITSSKKPHTTKHKLRVKVTAKKHSTPVKKEIKEDKDVFIENFDEKVSYYVHDYLEKEERTKRVVLTSGVVFFMLLVMFFYSFTIKKQFSLVAKNNSSDNFSETLIDTKTEFMNQIQEIADNYEDSKTERTEKASSPEQVQNTLPKIKEKDNITNKEILKIKDSIGKLKESLENNQNIE